MRRWHRFSAALARAAGFGRSLLIYYGQPWRIAAMRRHYGALVAPGDLVFDIGAHVGNQTRCLARLGARVVAIEPQPHLARWLRWLFRGDRRVTVVETALGARPGTASLYPSPRTPTVATLSTDWIATVGSTKSFAGVRWGAPLEVSVTTLDALIAQHGLPRFCKIDVEGFEAEILHGLSQPLPLLSFEYVPAAVEIACEAVGLLAALGPYRFNLTIGEQQSFRWPAWHEPAATLAWLRQRGPDDRSGDIYARLPGVADLADPAARAVILAF
jgi:FkbM family methyltransferase